MNPIDTTTSKRLDWLDNQLQEIASLSESTRQTLANQVERIYTERAALLREQPQQEDIYDSLTCTKYQTQLAKTRQPSRLRPV